MKRPTRALRLAVAAAATSLVLAACGDDSSDTADDEATGDETAEGGAAAEGDGVLRIGSLLPATGDLAFLGPPEFAGVDLAVKDINAAGGVLGKDVEEFDADSGDGTPDIAGQEVDKLFNRNVDVIIGAASSSVSQSVIDKITSAGVVQFSPANTAAGFDTYEDNGLYFRTAPSDVLQGRLLADLIVQDGFNNVAIMGRQDFYGEGLAEQVQESLEEKGATVTDFVLYNADAQKFSAEVAQIAATEPEALVLVSFDETAKIVPQLIANGIGPQDIQLYFVDGNLSNEYYADADYDLTGVKGTAPTAADPGDFIERLTEENPKLKDFTYGPEAYDATIISALAATAAESDAGEAIAQEIVGITTEGTECTTFEECKTLIEDGEDIDYQGVSGPVDMLDVGSLEAGTYGISEYGKGNQYEQVDTVSGVLEQ